MHTELPSGQWPGDEMCVGPCEMNTEDVGGVPATLVAHIEGGGVGVEVEGTFL